MAQNDNLDYFDIAEFDDNPFEEEYQSHSVEYSDLEDDDMNMNKQSGDTTAVEARNGKDIQGIPWERMNFSREKYREMRLKQYKNYQNLSYSPEKLQKECKEVEKGGTFFDFQFNTRLVKSTVVHFQEVIGRTKWYRKKGNNITGKIPEKLGNLTNQAVLIMENNSLTGEIPTSFGNLTKIQILSLSQDNLSGNIPDSISYLPHLGEIQLAYNGLSGLVPDLLFQVRKYNYCPQIKKTGGIGAVWEEESDPSLLEVWCFFYLWKRM